MNHEDPSTEYQGLRLQREKYFYVKKLMYGRKVDMILNEEKNVKIANIRTPLKNCEF